MYGAPGRIRTPDPQIRSLVLYPAELPVPDANICAVRRGLRVRAVSSGVRAALQGGNAAVAGQPE